MLERIIDVRTSHGAMNTYIVQPEGIALRPLVVLLMDAPGIRPELFDMARRMADAGYCVAVPNLYYRRTRLGVPSAAREVMYGHMQSLTAALVCADLEALLDDLDGSPGLRAGSFGCVGYCMSGPYALAAAAYFGARVVATASLHGVRLCHQGWDSPHRQCQSIHAEVYVGCAAVDAWAPPELIRLLGRHLQRHAVRHQIEWYPRTLHGFVFPERTGVYQHEAAEHHWERLLALFKRTLQKPAEIT